METSRLPIAEVDVASYDVIFLAGLQARARDLRMKDVDIWYLTSGDESPRTGASQMNTSMSRQRFNR